MRSAGVGAAISCSISISATLSALMERLMSAYVFDDAISWTCFSPVLMVWFSFREKSRVVRFAVEDEDQRAGRRRHLGSLRTIAARGAASRLIGMRVVTSNICVARPTDDHASATTRATRP